MRIKNIYIVIATLSIIMLCSCGGTNVKQETLYSKQEISYSKRISADSLYQVDIPTSFHEYKIVGDMMSFVKDYNGNAMASIMELPYNSDLDNYISSRQSDSFTYAILPGNGSNTRYFKVSRGNNFWRAYDYYGTKEVKGIMYVINLNSDSYSKEMMDTIFNHMLETLHSFEK